MKHDFISLAYLYIKKNIFLLGMLFLLFVSLFSSIQGNDIWWHLKTGEYILHETVIPHTDIFSFTVPDNEWIDLSWGFQVFSYLIFSVAGIKGLIFTKTFILALTLFLMVMPFPKKTSPVYILITFFPIIILFKIRAFMRPEIFSYFFAGFYFYLLRLYAQKEKYGLIWFLPLVQLLWVNMHSLFFIGPLIYTFFLFDYYIRKGQTNSGDFKQLLIVWLLICLINIINPYGLTGVVFPLELFSRISGKSEIFCYIEEFQPLLSSLVNVKIKLAVFALLGSIIFLFSLKKELRRLFYLGVFFIFVFLTFKAMRNVPLLALICGTIIFDWLRSACSKMGVFSKRTEIFLCICISLIMILFFVDTKMKVPYLRFHEKFTPVSAVKFLKEQKIEGNIFNVSVGTGGYLIWEMWPRQKVFTDARLEVYDEKFYREYFSIFGSYSKWLETVKKYDIEYALLDYTRMRKFLNPKLARDYQDFLSKLYDDHNWKMIYIDHLCVIFKREG